MDHILGGVWETECPPTLEFLVVSNNVGDGRSSKLHPELNSARFAGQGLFGRLTWLGCGKLNLCDELYGDHVLQAVFEAEDLAVRLGFRFASMIGPLSLGFWARGDFRLVFSSTRPPLSVSFSRSRSSWRSPSAPTGVWALEGDGSERENTVHIGAQETSRCSVCRRRAHVARVG